MPFLTIQNESFLYQSPLDMYQDNKSKKIHGVLDYQAEMIKQYMKHYTDKVVALELPTGCGKTLVGTLIGEYRRKKNNEKVVYLCPTIQLVNQVVQMAMLTYGLSATPFYGKQSEYNAVDKSNYLMKKTIAVTTYSAYFARGSFFSDADTVIMDDVHSSENYIISNWSVSVENTDPAFKQIVELIKPFISDNAYTNLLDSNSSHNANWCDMVPMPLLYDKLTELHAIFDSSFSQESPMKYSWSRIAEHMKECNLFISNKQIVLRPWIPPTLVGTSLNDAKQVILMSATLGKSGELERVTGLRKITRLPIVADWDKRGIGRKFFVFPEFILGDRERFNILAGLQRQFCKSVVLVGSKGAARMISEGIKNLIPELQVLTSSDVEKDKDVFLNADKAMLILPNRFDGVDFADEACRLLIIYNLPKVTNLQESFLVSSMAASSLYNERIRMRITQAVGRCTRNPSDYSVVCVLGDSLNNDLTKDERLRRFSPELRAEIKLGLDNSMEFQSLDDMLSQTDEFCRKTDNWNVIEHHIVSLRNQYSSEIFDDDDKVEDALSKAALIEVDYQYALWNNDYEKAYSCCFDIVKLLGVKELKGYRSFWQYLAGCSAFFLNKDGRREYESKAKDFFSKASDNMISVRWMSSLNNRLFNSPQEHDVDHDDMFGDVIVRIEKKLSSYPFMKNLQDDIDQVLKDISSEDGLIFERGHQKVGELLGYISINPEGDGVPDPIWYANDSVVIVSEDKVYQDNGYGLKRIPLVHVREANGHIIWLKNSYPELKKSCIIPLFITNAEQIEESARMEATDLYYLNRESFVKWCTKAMTALLEIYKSFSDEGCVEWRDSVHDRFVSDGIMPKDYINLICEHRLVEL